MENCSNKNSDKSKSMENRSKNLGVRKVYSFKKSISHLDHLMDKLNLKTGNDRTKSQRKSVPISHLMEALSIDTAMISQSDSAPISYTFYPPLYTKSGLQTRSKKLALAFTESGSHIDHLDAIFFTALLEHLTAQILGLADKKGTRIGAGYIKKLTELIESKDFSTNSSTLSDPSPVMKLTIYRVLQLVNPRGRISSKAMLLTHNFVNQVFHKILVMADNSNVITLMEIQRVIPHIFPGDLTELAVSQAFATLETYTSSD